MKAMIFAAGLGTRLRPLTNNKPKALVELKGKPLLQIQIEKLIKSGINEIVVNIHHYPELMIDFIKSTRFDAEIIISNESQLLLDTGGGLKFAAKHFSDGKPFLVHNVDIITDLNIGDMFDFHKRNNPLATLAVRNRKSSRYFLFDNENLLRGWTNKKSGEVISHNSNIPTIELAFSGIHIIDPKIFSMMPDKNTFSIVDVYLSAMKANKILGFRHDNSKWIDVGTAEKLKIAEKL